MADKTTPSGTVTRKPDDAVGTPGTPATGGGRHTPEQAAVTDMEPGGRTDADRHRETRDADSGKGGDPAPVGGSSGGHSDRKSAAGEGGKVAQGHYEVEKNR